MAFLAGRKQRIAAAILVLIALRLVAGALLPLSADEAYYWLWSKHLAAGYFDHPPAIAYCIRAGTLVFGDTEFGVRAAAILLSVAATGFVWRTGALLLEDEEAALTVALLFNLTLMIAVETLAATPDAPEVAASAAYLFALAKLVTTGDRRWWVAAGAAAGLALLSKYTAFFLGLGTLAWLVVDPAARRHLASPWLYAGGLVALLLFSPNLWWNAAHDWMTFRFQFGRIAQGGFTLRYLAEFLGAEFVLMSPFIFVLGTAGLGPAVRVERLRLLAGLLAPSIAYFVVHALHDRVQGNWPSFLTPAFAVLAVAASRAEWAGRGAAIVRVSKRLAAPVAAAMLALAYAQALVGIVPLGRADPISRLLGFGFDGVAQGLAQARTASGAQGIVTTDYATTAWLAFYAPVERPIVDLTEEQRWLDAPKRALGSGPFLYVVERRNDRHDFLASHFQSVHRLAEIARRRGHAQIAAYEIYRVSGLRGALDGRMP